SRGGRPGPAAGYALARPRPMEAWPGSGYCRRFSKRSQWPAVVEKPLHSPPVAVKSSRGGWARATSREVGSRTPPDPLSEHVQKEIVVVRIVSEVPLAQPGLRRLETRSAPGASSRRQVSVQALATHDHAWDLAEELLPGTEILLCKRPPRNLDQMA